MNIIGTGGYLDGKEAWEQGVPWLRPEATKHIIEHLPINAHILEWGMGGSTVYFLRKGYWVTSIESDSDWFYEVGKRLYKEQLRDRYFGIFTPKLKDYPKDAFLFDDNRFDLILVDGRNRCRCLGNALSRVKIGGMLCLDNSERREYQKAVALMDTWKEYSWGDEAWVTTVWHRDEHSKTDKVEFPDEDA